MDDDVIDLTRYIKTEAEGVAESESRGYFSVWGGDGERSRFALPLWRSVYLAAGKRAALVWSSPDAPERVNPFFVLDLGAEPARLEFDVIPVPEGAFHDRVPSLVEAHGMLVTYLGAHSEKMWFSVLDHRELHPEALEGKTREDLLFLAGECAGLLFHHDLASEAGPADGSGVDEDSD